MYRVCFSASDGTSEPSVQESRSQHSHLVSAWLKMSQSILHGNCPALQPPEAVSQLPLRGHQHHPMVLLLSSSGDRQGEFGDRPNHQFCVVPLVPAETRQWETGATGQAYGPGRGLGVPKMTGLVAVFTPEELICMENVTGSALLGLKAQATHGLWEGCSSCMVCPQHFIPSASH